MTPIINPWVFYFASVANVLKAISIIMSLGFAGSTIMCILYHFEDEWPLKYVKISIVGLVISCLMLVFVPTEKTIMKMVIAQNVTVERIETATTTVQSVYEDIMSLFENNRED